MNSLVDGEFSGRRTAIANGCQIERHLSNMLPPSMGPGGVPVGFAGSPGLSYTLWRAITVNGPRTAMATVAIGLGGIGSYVDAMPPAGKAFYRVTYP